MRPEWNRIQTKMFESTWGLNVFFLKSRSKSSPGELLWFIESSEYSRSLIMRELSNNNKKQAQICY